MSIRDKLLMQHAKEIGFLVEAPITIGGIYVPSLEDQGILYISGQVARLCNGIAVQGKVCQSVSTERAKLAAKICIIRCLAITYQKLGSLDLIEKMLQMNVYIQTEPDFYELSEIADSASELLYELFNDSGRHTRTTVGVASLPKNSTVEIDLSMRIK